MTLNEARELLGVDERADARAIRRAYLRAVKQHPPERDPEGFAQVRDAFELCRGVSAAMPCAPVAPVAQDAESGEPPVEWQAIQRSYEDALDMDERLELTGEILARAPDQALPFWARYDALMAALRVD